MPDSVQQKRLDSEESYLNTSFRDVHPLFLPVQNGVTALLKERLSLQLERFPAGRITKDARKQLLAATDRTIPQIAALLRFCDQRLFHNGIPQADRPDSGGVSKGKQEIKRACRQSNSAGSNQLSKLS